jgi:hypothetical protein
MEATSGPGSTLFTRVRRSGYPRKFGCRILHKTARERRKDGFCGLPHCVGRDHILWCCMKMRGSEYPRSAQRRSAWHKKETASPGC